MKIRYRAETWPVAGVFRIARGAVTSVDTLLVELEEDGVSGRGEATPESHYDQRLERCFEQLETVRPRLDSGVSRQQLQELLPAGAARNALDCALWDLEAKKTAVPAWQTAGLERFATITTAYTISVDTVDAMAAQAAKSSGRPLLKIKMAGGEDLERITAVRRAAPSSRIIVDANEAWDMDGLREIAPELAMLGVELIEQPLPAAHDASLSSYESPVPLCADEACLDRSSLDHVEGRYQFINIKLDKTGGLTEALLLAAAAEGRGLRLMVGCMLGTSLAMAPAAIIGNRAEFVDLDGPLLLAEDRDPGIDYQNSLMAPPPPELWG